MTILIEKHANNAHLIEVANPVRFKNRKIMTWLRLYCMKLLDNNVNCYLGTILIHKHENDPWQRSLEIINNLVEHLNTYPTIVNLWINIEVHRSRPKQKHTLHGRPHLHFIITFSGQNFLGPTLYNIESNLQKLSYDLRIKQVQRTLKDYVNTHKYLLKELKYNDILPYLNQIHLHHLNIYVYCKELLPSIKDVSNSIFLEYGHKFNLYNKINELNYLWSNDCCLEDYVIYIINYYMKNNNMIYNNGTILKLKSNMKYAYHIYQTWEEFITDLKFNDWLSRNGKILLNKVLRSRLKLKYELLPSVLNFEYIEFIDKIYNIKTQTWYNKDEFNDLNLKLRMSFNMYSNEITADLLTIKQWLNNNNINLELFMVALGSLLHDRKYIKDCPVPVLKGVSGAGKSLIISMYVDLIGKENVAVLSKSPVFKYEDFINKRLGNLEDLDWDDTKPEDIKNMFEGLPMIIDRKFKTITEVVIPRFVVTTNKSLDNYHKEDELAIKERCIFFIFHEKINSDIIENIKDEFPTFVILANELFLQK